MSTEGSYGKDFHEWLMGRGDFPVLEMEEVPMPKGYYVCWECKKVSNHYPPGGVCASCELRGDQQAEEMMGN